MAWLHMTAQENNVVQAEMWAVGEFSRLKNKQIKSLVFRPYSVLDVRYTSCLYRDMLNMSCYGKSLLNVIWQLGRLNAHRTDK